MEYKKLVRYAKNITKDDKISHDLVHDYWLHMKERGVDVMTAVLPKNYIYTGLKRTFTNNTFNDTWYTSGRVRYYNVKISLDSLMYRTGEEERKTKPFEVFAKCDSFDAATDAAYTLSLLEKIVEDNCAKSTANNIKPELYKQILGFKLQGWKNIEIAKTTGIDQQTVWHYVNTIRKWISHLK